MVDTISNATTGPQLVTAFNDNAATLAAAQTAIAAIQAQIGAVPNGTYTAPGAGQYQIYGTTGAAWTTATSTGKANIVNTPNSNTAFGDIWSLANGMDFVFTNDASMGLTARLVTTTAGVPVVTASVAMPVPQTGYTTITTIYQQPTVLYAVAISATAVKVVYGYNCLYYVTTNNYQAHNYTQSAVVSWNGTTLSVSNASTDGGSYWSGTSTYGNYASYSTPLNNRRAFLLGSVSMLGFTAGTGAGAPLSVGANLHTRVVDSAHLGMDGGATNPLAWLGGGWRVETFGQTTLYDATSRPTFYLDCDDEMAQNSVAYYRLPGYSFSSVVGAWAFSNTLVAVQWKDASSNVYTTFLSVTTGATPAITPLFTSNAGNLGVALNSLQPVCWSATDAYLYLSTTGTTAKFTRMNFNPSSNTGTATATINVVCGAGITGITAVGLIGWWQSGTDQLTVVYAATATTNGIWIEKFTLA